jgi:hypothetical protein
MKQDGIFAKDQVVIIYTEKIASSAIQIINETKKKFSLQLSFLNFPCKNHFCVFSSNVYIRRVNIHNT